MAAGGNTNRCSNCGAPIFAQWWDSDQNAYKCRACGTLNSGLAPKPPARLVWRLWVCTVAWGLFGLTILVPLVNPSAHDSEGWAGAVLILLGIPFTVLLGFAAVSTWQMRRKG